MILYMRRHDRRGDEEDVMIDAITQGGERYRSTNAKDQYEAILAILDACLFCLLLAQG